MFEVEKKRLTEQERVEQTNLRENCVIAGRRIKIIFWASIANIVLNNLSTFGLLGASGSMSAKIVSGICAGIGILIAIVLLSLGRFNSYFRYAGGACLLAQFLNYATASLPEGGIGSMLSVLAMVATAVYILALCSGMNETVNEVDGYIADSWISFKKTYIVVAAGLLISMVMVLLPALSGLAMLGVLVFSIVAIVLSIWELVLLFRSGKAMTSFAKTPIEE